MTVFNDKLNTALPDGDDDPADADNNMRRIQGAVQELLNVNHIADKTGTEVSDADSGEHRNILFHAPIASTPTVAENHGDLRTKDVSSKAELHWTDEDENELQLTSKGNNLANATYLKATNEAGNGSVNLIKAGKNVADDTDVAIVPDLTRTASNAAPVEDTDLANKKYVDAHGIVQVVNTQSGAVNTGTTQMPYDDTIPQKTEGDEYMTLAITPKSATNKLMIEVVIVLANSSGGSHDALTAALFQDSTAAALAGISNHLSFVNEPIILNFKHFMTAGTTNETTFKVRAGLAEAGTTTFNGQSTARRLGGVSASSITITEIKN
ncbi:MAG: hypothetical protein V3U75_04040 [Methylococcaceae bacterium]